MFERFRDFFAPIEQNLYERMLVSFRANNLGDIVRTVSELDGSVDASEYFYTLKSILYNYVDQAAANSDMDLHPFSSFVVIQTPEQLLVSQQDQLYDLHGTDQSMIQVYQTTLDSNRPYYCSIHGRTYTNNKHTEGVMFTFVERDGNPPILGGVEGFVVPRPKPVEHVTGQTSSYTSEYNKYFRSQNF